MTDKKDKGPWAKHEARKNTLLLGTFYCALVAGVGLVLVMSGVGMKEMYETLKDDEYLTDDGLPYRDMENATYTYPASEIDALAEGYNWMIFGGGAAAIGSMAVLFAMAYFMPERKEMHLLICKGTSESKYCPECGLKLSKLEKD